MTCSKILREQGKPYPRTCPVHGLSPFQSTPIKNESLLRRVIELEKVIVNARREFRNGGDPIDARAWLFRVTIDEGQYAEESA